MYDQQTEQNNVEGGQEHGKGRLTPEKVLSLRDRTKQKEYDS